MFRTVLFAVLILVFVNVGIVQAQEVADEQKPLGTSEELAKERSDELNERIGETLDSLGYQESAHFMVLHTNYNIYSMVKAVRNDISEAVEKCAENNPSIASQVRSKFENWDKNVGASMKESLDMITSMQLAQTYLPQSEFKKLFGVVDEIRSINSSRFEKTPVTTPAACKYMMSKMDETEERMKDLLSATLNILPSVVRQNQK